MKILEIVLTVAALVVSVGVPVGLWIFSAFRADLLRLHERIDQHISNYSIHKVSAAAVLLLLCAGCSMTRTAPVFAVEKTVTISGNTATGKLY